MFTATCWPDPSIPWLIGVARHKLADHWRRVEREQRAVPKNNVIDMARQLEIEAGVPVAAPIDGDGAVFSAVLPAGRYATLIHVGHPSGLVGATATLLEWASEQGLAFDMSERDGAEHWACRLEIYFTDSSQEPDMDKWETQLAFKLAD